MSKLLAIAIGGAIGAIARASACTITERHLGADFPYGTLLVNIAGGFMIGMIAGLSSSMELHPLVRDAVVIGGLGALTTFSTFSLDTLTLASGGNLLHALGNIAANVVLALAATGGGVLLGRSL
ncbi:MAG: fluoride efflux transporter CrcB [Armatimonadota bacterium]